MATANNHQVYRHLREDGRVFYIGKGLPRRRNQTTSRNPYWHNIVKNGYTIEIVAQNLTEEEAFELEMFLIAEYGEMGLCEANLTQGGEGISGFTFTDKQKLEQSKRLKGNTNKKGTKVGTEGRKRMSESAKGKTYTEEQKLIFKVKNIKYIYTTPYGAFVSLSDIVKETGIAMSTIRNRIKNNVDGWSRRVV